MLYEVIVCSSAQKKRVTCELSRKEWAFLLVCIVAVPGKNMKLLEKDKYCEMLLLSQLHLLWGKSEKERWKESLGPLERQERLGHLKEGFDATTSSKFDTSICCSSSSSRVFLGSASQ